LVEIQNGDVRSKSIYMKSEDNKMIGIGATVALGGVLLKGAAKLSVEKGFGFGAKKAINHFAEKNKGEDTKFGKFLGKMIGVSNEELAALIDQRSEELKTAMISGTTQLDETSSGLLEMIRQTQDMMKNYQRLDHEDRQFIQSLKDAVNPDTLAKEIVETMKAYQGEGLKVEDIREEIGDLFSSMGWSDKFDQVQSCLSRMEGDIGKILDRTGAMADEISGIKETLESDSMGEKKTDIADSVMTRSNVITAGGDVMNITGGGKYIGDGAVNIEGETVNYTNVDAKALSKDDWKDVLSSAIKDIGIGTELERDLKGMEDEQNLSYSGIAMKFKEVDSLYDNMEMDSDIFLRMGNALFLNGDYKKSYDCYMRALAEKKVAARANMAFMFSDKNFRDRLLREVGKSASNIQFSLKELYRSNDLRNYRTVKTIHDELTMFETDVKASVEGTIRERDRHGSTGGIDQDSYGEIAGLYEDVYTMVNSIARKAENIQNGVLSGDSVGVTEIAAPLRAEVQQLKQRYADRMSIIKEVS